MLACRAAELARADRVEAEADHRLPVLEGLLGIDQALARNADALFDEIVDDLPERVRALVPARAGRRSGRRVRIALVQQVEGELGGLREQVLDRVRVVHAGKLHDDAVQAVALDRRLPEPEFVQAYAQDFQSLLDGGALDIDDDFLWIFQPCRAGIVDIDCHQTVPFGDKPPGAVDIPRLPQGKHHGVAAHAEPAIADALVAQAAAHIVLNRLQALLQHGGRLHLDQQVRTALQVKPEIDGLVRYPARKIRAEAVRPPEVRRCVDQAQQTDRQDDDDLPPGEVEHGRASCPCGRTARRGGCRPLPDRPARRLAPAGVWTAHP